MLSSTTQFFLAFIGGALPALIWLWFWYREDRLHPEPKFLILLCFLCGMLAVPLVIPFQSWVHSFFSGTGITFVLWALIEEVFKYLAAYVSVLTRKQVDEPIDYMMYLITAALGFAAMENTFFLISPIHNGQILTGIITGNLRFIGATLLHTVATATVGIFIAFAFYKSKLHKRIFTAIGLFFAVVLHTLFNLSIIEDSSIHNVIAFYSVWIAIVVLILFFEKIKTITSTS